MCWNAKGLDECAERMFGEEKTSHEREMLHNCQQYLQHILLVVFGNGALDDDLIDSLEEMAAILNVKFPKDIDFKIEKKNDLLKQIQFLMKATV